MQSRRELPAADLDAAAESLSAALLFEASDADPEHAFFHRLIEDEVVQAIDELPEHFQEVIVLSDPGDLKYSEVAEVLGIPVHARAASAAEARFLPV